MSRQDQVGNDFKWSVFPSRRVTPLCIPVQSVTVLYVCKMLCPHWSVVASQPVFDHISVYCLLEHKKSIRKIILSSISTNWQTIH